MTAIDAQASTQSRPVFQRHPLAQRPVLKSLFLLAWCLLVPVGATAFAQPAKPADISAPAGKPAAVVVPAKPPEFRPVWAELTVQHQQALRPLAPSWHTISEAQKRKWLQVSKNFQALTPEEQNTMHSRMTEWVGLSAQQRAQARLNFAKTKELSKELTPDEKKAKWQTYQALSAEEKQSLAAKAAPKPAGAATAVKPVPSQKLAVIPPPTAREGRAPTRPSALQPVQGGDAAAAGTAFPTEPKR